MARTIIGPGLEIEGELMGEDALVVRGRLKGRVAVRAPMSIERSGFVEADVDAEALDVTGSLEGNVVAKSRIEISAEGHVRGDLRAPRILIADGARFRGNVDMER